MQYTVNLYKADANGFLIARACLKSALKLGGVNERDTRLLSPEIPQWNYTSYYARTPQYELGCTKLRAFDLKRMLPDLQDPQVAKCFDGNDLDLAVIRGLLAVGANSYGGLYLQYLMSYPRWMNGNGTIEVGGKDYFDILEEAANSEKKAVKAGLSPNRADTSRIASINDRKHKRMAQMANAQDPVKAFHAEESLMRGDIDEVSNRFMGFIKAVGFKTGCNAAAGAVINSVRRLIELLGRCGINDFVTLDAACNDAEDALTTLGLELAKKQDAAAQPPTKVVLVGEQAEQLASAAINSEIAATSSNVAADNSEWLKTEETRKKRNRKKTGKKNQQEGEKNGNGHKTDKNLKNQIMTEVRAMMRSDKFSQSTACRIVAMKHLKDDSTTPMYNNRTIENWMSKAKGRHKP